MSCPFCAIAAGSPSSPDPPIVSGPTASAYIVLSTSTVIAFLDIAPLTLGHVLLCPREHRAKITDLTLQESAAMGFWIPVLSKAVMKAVGLEIEGESWNVVQANGTEAGQTVPHAHFHIIPRPVSGGAREPSDISDAERKNIALAEGARERLGHEDGVEISEKVKLEIAREVARLKVEGDIVEGEKEGEMYCVLRGEGGLKL